jgi:DNA polymerase-3 subunit delta
MKLTGQRIEAFLRRPDPSIRAVLLFGPDRGLVRERADALSAVAAGDPADPFRICELATAALKDEPARLIDEMASLSLSGGLRLVRLREATDAAAAAIADALAAAPSGSLLIAEAGDLGKRSALRTLFEAATNAASIPCYSDDETSLQRLVAATLEAASLTATPDAAAYLATNLGGDRAMTRCELDKLITYMGGPGTIDLDDAMACVGDSHEASLDALVMTVADGDSARLDRALSAAFAFGLQPVTVIRAVGRHFQRLHLGAGLIAAGRSPQEAMAALRPPVFYKMQSAVRTQLCLWAPPAIANVLRLLVDAEVTCKQTGAPAEAICARALFQIAGVARGRAR